jgi:ATP-dependent Clp protease protease subunit
MNLILAKHTGQSFERIEKDVERDYILTASQAKDYGIVDQVISKKE